MNLLRCLALLNSVSFVAAQCSLVFPWLTSNECGVDPLDNTYPEYPVSYIGACGPAYTAVNQEILGFATYTATNAIKSEVAAEPSGDPDVAYTYTVSDVANNAIQLGSVVTVSFTDRQELSVTGSFTYAAVPKPSIFFTTPTSTVQASIVVTTTLSESKCPPKMHQGLPRTRSEHFHRGANYNLHAPSGYYDKSMHCANLNCHCKDIHIHHYAHHHAKASHCYQYPVLMEYYQASMSPMQEGWCKA